MLICHPDDHQEHQDLNLDLLAADSGPVHHLLGLVGLLLRAEGDEGIPDQDKLVKNKLCNQVSFSTYLIFCDYHRRP